MRGGAIRQGKQEETPAVDGNGEYAMSIGELPTNVGGGDWTVEGGLKTVARQPITVGRYGIREFI
jgi:hypothetical protein